MRTFRVVRCLTALGVALALAATAVARRPDGVLQLSVLDAGTGQPLAARIELTNAQGRPTRPDKTPEPLGSARLGNHAYLDGTGTLGLKRGAYRFTLDAGPEYRTQHGHFEIARHAEDSKAVEMRRAADLAAEGWSAADLGSCRPLDDYPLLQRAESLACTPKLAVAWDGTAWKRPRLAERRRRDKPPFGATALWDDPRGVVWLIDPNASLGIEALPTPGDSSVAFLRAARDGGWRVVAAITSRELPLWVAHETIDAVVVADDWIAEERTVPADESAYSGPQGPGRWRRALYLSLIDAGVRLPAVAVTGSGLNTTPIGASRAYAYTEGDDSPTAWWQAADRLATFVTNGPLLRPFVEGAPPGETFLLPASGKRSLSISLSLATRTRIEYLEILKDGSVARTVRLAEVAASGGRLPEIEFDAPGWLALAAVAEEAERYQFALSSPWFVEGPGGGRRDPADVQAWQAALEAARTDFGAVDSASYDQAAAWWASRLDRTGSPGS